MPKGENVIPFPKGDEANRFHHADDQLSASSPSAASGEPVIQFPGSAAASSGDIEGTEVASASVPSFAQLGDLTHAVVLRLKNKFPRVSVRGVAGGKPPLS